jgi:DNA-3-methyladenine glycosylase
MTPRTQVLFGPAGIIYVYLIYGMYHCLNVVTDTPESGGAVLIRSLIPVENITGRTDGPGRLCKSLGINRTLNGLPVYHEPLTIQRQENKPAVQFESLPRIGIDYAGEDKDHPYRYRIVETA